MGPTSDLGPIDPQLIVTGKRPIYVPARDIIAAVKAAEKRIKANPAIFPLYASLFEDISVVHLAAARSAVARVDDQLTEAIKSVTSRDCGAAESLEAKLKGPLVKNPTSHSTTIPASVAQKELGLPVRILASSSCQWQHIWGLWTRYLVILGKQGIASPMQIYEGQTASRIE